MECESNMYMSGGRVTGGHRKEGEERREIVKIRVCPDVNEPGINAP